MSIKIPYKSIVLLTLTLLVATLIGVTIFVFREMKTSVYQAHYLARLASELSWEMESGANDGLSVPQAGPYDIRLGYNRLPFFLENLTKYDFHVSAQAKFSPRMKQLAEQGLFVPYREKTQAGLEITDRNHHPLYRAIFPGSVYENYASIPPIIRDSLLYIENRELLDTDYPRKNPAIEWTRLGKGGLDKIIQFFHPAHHVAGGSTLATQIEKYRHSPNGVTLTLSDKLQQIQSASIRAYLDGEETLPVRQQLVTDYLNTVPLAAIAGLGEINGLGDGLRAWYGLDFKLGNPILKEWNASGASLEATAMYYKHALSLMVAQRRPSFYLISNRNALEELTNSHLRILTEAGIISPDLSNAAMKVPLQFRNEHASNENKNLSSSKAVNTVRLHLGSMLGLQHWYDLDRLDLSVDSTLDGSLQEKITRILRQLSDEEYARSAGLYGDHLLGEADPSRIIYSFTLSELTQNGAKFRIQADTLAQPLDVNNGTKLDLGSTAKLRTLVTYLEIIETLYRKYTALSPDALTGMLSDAHDPLSRWAIEYLQQDNEPSLHAMLEAALERKYSANPRERFFTGGGAHYFQNFNHTDDSRILSVREATHHSVNLVYIRMMRDIVRYHMLQSQGSSARILRDVNHPDREEYLKKFTEMEGKEFIKQFYKKYRGKEKSASGVDEIFFSSFRHMSPRVTAAYRFIHPEASFTQFKEFIAIRFPDYMELDENTLHKQYQRYPPGKYTLADQGYITSVHPLELWLARYLTLHPDAGYQDIILASKDQFLDVYRWLFRTARKNAQDIRIRSLLELEAFLEIHRSWKRLGYPFDMLVPSLASAIGSSADRPGALAELMGTILNKGVQITAVLVERLQFAAGTPFETILEHTPETGKRLLSPELAAAVRSVLTGTVEKGTASRLANSIITEDGIRIPIGGKTGTGDHRHITFSAPGVIRKSEVVNRTATFAFFIGDRFFGTLTAFVPGPEAANYRFTSALPTQILKHLLPALRPLVETAEPYPEPVASGKRS